MATSQGMPLPESSAVIRLYRRKWPAVSLCLCRPDGRDWLASPRHRSVPVDLLAARRLAIHESLRWGEPAIESGPRHTLFWAVPLMNNARLLGGLVASITERKLFRNASRPTIDLKTACTHLRQLAEQHNLTNAALLESLRHTYQREQLRAQAIHAFKADSGYNIRKAYLLDEPALVAAIRRADRGEARALVNRLLVGMIHHAQGRFDLVKSFFMELVVTLCRAAVEAGGAPEELLGANFSRVGEVASLRDDEQLAAWLHQMLERIMDTIERTRKNSPARIIATAWQYIQSHATENISRDHVARVAGISPSHFSRLLHSQMGKGFPDLVNHVRIRKAAELLVETDKPLKIIALDAGFKDQSYFTKVFLRHLRRTPRQYRRQNALAE